MRPFHNITCFVEDFIFSIKTGCIAPCGLKFYFNVMKCYHELIGTI